MADQYYLFLFGTDGSLSFNWFLADLHFVNPVTYYKISTQPLTLTWGTFVVGSLGQEVDLFVSSAK